MKVFAIWDDDWENKTPIGYLFCYEKENAFMIELNSELDEWNAPLLFQINYIVLFDVRQTLF